MPASRALRPVVRLAAEGGETLEPKLQSWRIHVERLSPTCTDLVAMYDEAAERWHDRLALLGYLVAHRFGLRISPRDIGRSNKARRMTDA